MSRMCPINFLSTVQRKSDRKLGRRKSFYDMESVKSRNIEKFEKLENRMKCSLSSRSSPRKAAQLILKQALSQPAETVSAAASCSKDKIVIVSTIDTDLCQPRTGV